MTIVYTKTFEITEEELNEVVTLLANDVPTERTLTLQEVLDNQALKEYLCDGIIACDHDVQEFYLCDGWCDWQGYR